MKRETENADRKMKDARRGAEVPKRTTQNPKTIQRGALPHVPAAVVVLAAVVLGYRFFYIAWKYSVNLFYWDQWDYLAPLFRQPPRYSELFLQQLGPHREGIGLVADRFLFPLTHWNERADSFLIAGCIWAAMLLALALKRKVFGKLALTDIAIPAIFLTSAQYDVLIFVPNPAYGGFPLLMIMMFCLVCVWRSSPFRFGVLLLLDGLLIYTGFGLFMGVITLLLFAFEIFWSSRGESTTPVWLPLAGFAIATVLLGSFFIHYSWPAAMECFAPPQHRPARQLWFLVIMFSRFFLSSRNLWLITAIGSWFLAVTVRVLAFHLRELARRGPIAGAVVGAVLIGFSLIFSISATMGRQCSELPAAAQLSRYVTLMIPAFLGLYFFLLSRGAGRLRNFALWPFVLACLLGSLVWQKTTPQRIADFKTKWADCYRAVQDIPRCDMEAGYKNYPYPEATNMKQKLDFLQLRGLNLFAGTGPK